MDAEHDDLWYINLLITFVSILLVIVYALPLLGLIVFWVFALLYALQGSPLPVVSGWFAIAHYWLLGMTIAWCVGLVVLLSTPRERKGAETDPRPYVAIIALIAAGLLAGVIYLHRSHMATGRMLSALQPFVATFRENVDLVRGGGFSPRLRRRAGDPAVSTGQLKTPFVVIECERREDLRLSTLLRPPEFPLAMSPDEVRGVVLIDVGDHRSGYNDEGAYDKLEVNCYIVDVTGTQPVVVAKKVFGGSDVVTYGSPASMPRAAIPYGAIKEWIVKGLDASAP